MRSSQNASAIADGYEPNTGLTRRPNISQRISSKPTDATVIIQRGIGLRSADSFFAAAFSCLSAISTISAPWACHAVHARPCIAFRQIQTFRAQVQDPGGAA